MMTDWHVSASKGTEQQGITKETKEGTMLLGMMQEKLMVKAKLPFGLHSQVEGRGAKISLGLP